MSGRQLATGRVPTSWILPTQLNGCIAWYRADMGITLNGSTVSQWNDQSGTGDSAKNLKQPVTAQQPTWNSNDPNFNNQATVSFVSGTGPTVQAQSLSGSNFAQLINLPVTTVLVASVVTNGTVQGVAGGQDQGTVHFHTRLSAANKWTIADAVALNSNATATSPLPMVVAGQFNGTNSNVFVNASQTANVNGTAGTQTNSTGLCVGMLPTTGQGFTGTLAEFIVYDHVLNGAEMSALFVYLAARYAIPGAG